MRTRLTQAAQQTTLAENRRAHTAHPGVRLTARPSGSHSFSAIPLFPEETRDQTASLSMFEESYYGVGIEVESKDVDPTPEFPSGFRWSQVVDTNVPLGGTSSPYVDPRPRDFDTPFYYSETAHKSTFSDYPTRPPRRDSPPVITWQASLCLNGVNLAEKTATPFECFTYGFTIKKTGEITGEVTLIKPQSGAWSAYAAHRKTLAAEFPKWTFALQKGTPKKSKQGQ